MKWEGKELKLSPRKVFDILALRKAIEDKSYSDAVGTMAMANTINDSLKATYLNLVHGIRNASYFQKIKLWRESRKYKPFFKGCPGKILEAFATQELKEIFQEVIKLERGTQNG